MEYIIMYLETEKGASVLEFEKESLTPTLIDLVSEFMCVYNSFKLYQSCTNTGCIGCFAEIADGEITLNNELYSEYFA